MARVKLCRSMDNIILKPRGSNEAFFWLIFSGGGVVAAMLIPALIASTILGGFGIEEAQNAFSYERIHSLLSNWIARIFILIVIAASLMHAAHRIRHTIHDTRIPVPYLISAAVCYLSALGASGVAALLLATL